MTSTLAPAMDMFRPNDEVRLLFRHGDIRSGARGRVVGRFARRTDPTFVVSFQNQAGCIEVRADELALA